MKKAGRIYWFGGKTYPVICVIGFWTAFVSLIQDFAGYEFLTYGDTIMIILSDAEQNIYYDL